MRIVLCLLCRILFVCPRGSGSSSSILTAFLTTFVWNSLIQESGIDSDMKPAIVADEMFPEGAGPYMDFEEAGGSTGLLMDLAANEKAVHADFFNDFEDLFDDDNLD